MKQLTIIIIAALTSCTCLYAQEGKTAYTFLDIPVSAHSAALGGNNVSAIEDDITLMFTNPAALANVSDKTFNVDYLSYMAGTNKLSAGFSLVTGERSTWGIGATYLNYGDLLRTNEYYQEQGHFNAKDIGIQTSYCYSLSDFWVGGVTTKVLFSNYGSYSSTGIGVDLGLNYYDDEAGFSWSLVAQNLGGQIKSFDDKHESMPFHLVMGLSKELSSAPLRFSLTLDDLTHWDADYYYNATGEKDSFGSRLVKHIGVGLDVFPSSNTWLAVGYNFRRGKEMKVADSSHWAGFSAGAGLAIKRFQVGVAYAKYHVSASSILVNASFSL